jgi:hypothetical protein
MWLRNGKELKSSDTIKIESDAALQTLTLLKPVVDDSGCYQCEVGISFLENK